MSSSARDWTGNGVLVGGVLKLWSDPDNWSPHGVPQNGESLLFHNDSVLVDPPQMFNDLTNLTVSSLEFSSLDLFNSHWELFGNTLGISSGVFNDVNYDCQVQIHCGLKLAGSARFVTGQIINPGPLVTTEEMDLRFSGPIDLNGNNLELLADGEVSVIGHLYIEAGISGTGNVWATAGGKDGIFYRVGVCEFKSAGSSFTGTLTLNPRPDSTVIFSVPSGNVVNDRLVVTNVGTVRWDYSEQIGDGATVRLSDGATLSLNNHAESILNLELITDSNDSRPAVLDAGPAGLLGLYGNISAVCNNDPQTPAIRGKITLTPGEHDFNVSGSAYAGLDMQAQILGSGNFSKTGNSALLLTASNSCNSSISIMQGTLDVRHYHALGDTAGPTQLFGGALLLRNVAIADETLFALGQGTSGALPGSVLTSVGACSWSGPVMLNTNLVITGDMTFAGVLSGVGGLGCFGGGTVHLTGNNTYTGTNYVSGSILQVDGVQPLSPVDLHDLAVLQGPGTVGDIVVKGGATMIAPGNSPGVLTCNNFDASGGNGQLDIELNGTTPGAGYDQLNANGTVNLTGLSLNATRGFSAAQGDAFTIINNDGNDPVVGAFTGLRQDSQVRIGNDSYRVDYAGGTGNDVVLTRLGYDITWTNDASGDWNDASNWNPNRVPGTNDTVFINKTVTVTLNTAVECYCLNLSTSGSLSPTLTGSGDLTVYVLEFYRGNLSGSQTVKVLHQMDWVGFLDRSLRPDYSPATGLTTISGGPP